MMPQRPLSSRFLCAIQLWIAASVCGCCLTASNEGLSRLVTIESQDDVDKLDRAGIEGAMILIGILEVDADWVLMVNSSDDKYIHVSALRTAAREHEIDGVPFPIVDPPGVDLANLVIRNAYVLRWAEANPKTEVFRHRR